MEKYAITLSEKTEKELILPIFLGDEHECFAMVSKEKMMYAITGYGQTMVFSGAPIKDKIVAAFEKLSPIPQEKFIYRFNACLLSISPAK